MLDKKDLDAIEEMFNEKFLEIENKLNKNIDTKFEILFIKLEETINQKYALQDNIIDIFSEYSKYNFHKYDEYNTIFSQINSKLLNHDLRLISLEAHSSTTI